MRFDLDTYKEILDTITRNKSRSLLTGFGVFWGVFMLIVLMGGGQGLKELLQANFSGFATNTAVIWAQNTTKPYKGFNKGRSWLSSMSSPRSSSEEEKMLSLPTRVSVAAHRASILIMQKSLFQRCFMADTSTIWMCASSARYVS